MTTFDRVAESSLTAERRDSWGDRVKRSFAHRVPAPCRRTRKPNSPFGNLEGRDLRRISLDDENIVSLIAPTPRCRLRLKCKPQNEKSPAIGGSFDYERSESRSLRDLSFKRSSSKVMIETP